MTEVEFDSEVMALVEDLGLVEIGSLEYTDRATVQADRHGQDHRLQLHHLNECSRQELK